MISARRWYEPSIGPAPSVKWFNISVDAAPSDGAGWAPVMQLHVAVLGRSVVLNIITLLVRALLFAFLWIALWGIFPSEFLMRGGVVFDAFTTILFSSVLGGTITVLFEIPTTPGVLWGALIWNHIGPEVGYLTSGITTTMRSAASNYAVSVIVASAGLSCDLRTVRQKWPLVLAMTFLPFLFEMTIHSVIAKEVFSFPNYSWAFLQGAVFSGIAPGVLIPGMQLLSNQKFLSQPSGLFVALYPAIVLEAVVAVWCIGFTADMTFLDPNASTDSIALKALLGPIQVLVGAAVGFTLALALHFTVTMLLFSKNRHLWHQGINASHEQPMHTSSNSAALLFQGTNLVLVCTGNILGFSGGASIAVAVMACTLANFWKLAPDNDVPTPIQRAMSDQFIQLQQLQGHAWGSIAVPFLFSMTGSAIDLTKVFNAEFFPRALACFAGGISVRMMVVFTIIKLSGYAAVDALIIAVGWIAKGSIQASLGSVAFLRSTTPQEEELGKTILVMSMLGTMVCAVAAATGISVLGRRLMVKAES